jgi:Ca-activated chloride channel homolog
MLSFSHPQILWLLLILPLIGFWAAISHRNKNKRLKTYIHPDMIGRLYNYRHSFLKIQHVLLLLSLLMIILAAGGLRVGSGLRELKREGMDVIVALDVSASMDADDISPSRLERSKYEILRLIRQLQGDRIGLVAFAGVAYLQSPITSDYRTTMMMLELMDTDLLPVQGTAFADALQTALDAFPDENQKYKAVIMISDGEDHEQEINKIVARAVEENVLIYTLGVGTNKGSTIPVYNDKGELIDYRRDSDGSVIHSSLQENTLREIAAATGGRYYRVGSVREPILQIYEHILHGDRQEYQTHEFAEYRELYVIFAAAGLLLLLLSVLLPEGIPKKDNKQMADQ